MRRERMESQPPQESWQLERKLGEAFQNRDAAEVLSSLYLIDRILCRDGQTCRQSVRTAEVERFLRDEKNHGEAVLEYPLHVSVKAKLVVRAVAGVIHCTVEGCDAATVTWESVR